MAYLVSHLINKGTVYSKSSCIHLSNLVIPTFLSMIYRMPLAVLIATKNDDLYILFFFQYN